MSAPRTGSPYRELVSPIAYGILAHSHSWSTAQAAVAKINEYVITGGKNHAIHAREHIDLVCVADTCVALKSVEFRRLANLPDSSPDQLLCLVGNFFACTGSPSIGSLLAYLLIRLGWEDPHVRPFAEYFRLARMLSRSFGGAANLDPPGLTPETEAAARERSADFLDSPPWSWDEWAFSLE